jgi:UDP-N-acetylglucosamine 2-epimerase (non-hydrolysing)
VAPALAFIAMSTLYASTQLDPPADPRALEQAAESANTQRRPLFIVVLATKPCYIKLASLVHALDRMRLPFLLVDTGQHYDSVLTGAKEELAYQHLIGAHLRVRGGLLGRAADLAQKVQWLAAELRRAGLRQQPVPVVSGDTSTAALFPTFWYLATGVRSVHVEAGLRSMGPEISWERPGLEELLSQREARWKRERDEPFPEGIDTTLASVASDLLLAPVQINAEHLIREGYAPEKIQLVGSLSADAVGLALDGAGHQPPPGVASELASGRWLRVDIHRRENTTPARLKAVIEGVSRFSRRGGRVAFVMTNAVRAALAEHGMEEVLRAAERQFGVLVQDLWPSYLDVVRFMRSPNCQAIFTDSGGLQEEANVLGVPCITCRHSTDRPETVLEGATNILVPPTSPEAVEQSLAALLSAPPEKVWPGLKTRRLYGARVGERIARVLGEYAPPPAAAGAEFIF